MIARKPSPSLLLFAMPEELYVTLQILVTFYPGMLLYIFYNITRLLDLVGFSHNGLAHPQIPPIPPSSPCEAQGMVDQRQPWSPCGRGYLHLWQTSPQADVSVFGLATTSIRVKSVQHHRITLSAIVLPRRVVRDGTGGGDHVRGAETVQHLVGNGSLRHDRV